MNTLNNKKNNNMFYMNTLYYKKSNNIYNANYYIFFILIARIVRYFK
jgi:hypothetical protein